MTQARLYKMRYKEKYPWRVTFTDIKRRCKDKKSRYYAKGIKCFITIDEVKQLWFRDKAYNLKRASIDRIDNEGDYTFENCRYIEFGENSNRCKCKPIGQYDITGKLVAVYASKREASRVFKSDLAWLIHVIRFGKISKGYLWKELK